MFHELYVLFYIMAKEHFFFTLMVLFLICSTIYFFIVWLDRMSLRRKYRELDKWCKKHPDCSGSHEIDTREM